MRKLWHCILKEYKVLIRDKGALGITFLMPVLLVFIVTIIQDNSFKSVNENSVPLLIADSDNDSISINLERSLNRGKAFKITRTEMNMELAINEVAKGNYLIGIIIPKGSSELLRKKSSERIAKSFGGDSLQGTHEELKIQVYFDPITKESFKVTVGTAINQIMMGIEMQSTMDVLNAQLKSVPGAKPVKFDAKSLVSIEENYASKKENTIVPNAVQHNVPAWTMFAMFFICIPLSGNIIREREEGSAFRLLTMPGSYAKVMIGKIVTYLAVNLLQFALMISVGLFFLPMLGMDKLVIGDNPLTLLTVALVSGLAATGYGLLVGTVANSQDQAALFGADRR